MDSGIGGIDGRFIARGDNGGGSDGDERDGSVRPQAAPREAAPLAQLVLALWRLARLPSSPQV
jgi:hypothetical protein